MHVQLKKIIMFEEEGSWRFLDKKDEEDYDWSEED